MLNDLTVSEFARVTNTSKTTVWRMIRGGQVRVYRMGRAVRIPREELVRLRQGGSDHA
jgi:excisionase family DNA binding protein